MTDADDFTPTTEEVERRLRLAYYMAPEAFRRWLATRDAARDCEVAERAWDKGAKHVMDAYSIPGDPSDGNPYR